jgi:hypothetical protein
MPVLRTEVDCNAHLYRGGWRATVAPAQLRMYPVYPLKQIVPAKIAQCKRKEGTIPKIICAAPGDSSSFNLQAPSLPSRSLSGLRRGD